MMSCPLVHFQPLGSFLPAASARVTGLAAAHVTCWRLVILKPSMLQPAAEDAAEGMTRVAARGAAMRRDRMDMRRPYAGRRALRQSNWTNVCVRPRTARG